MHNESMLHTSERVPSPPATTMASVASSSFSINERAWPSFPVATTLTLNPARCSKGAQ